MWRVWLLVFTLVLSPSVSAGAVQLAVGQSSPKWGGYDDSIAYRLAYNQVTDWWQKWLNDYGIRIHLEFAYLYWQDDLLDDKHGMSINPVFRYRWHGLGVNWFVEGGVGATYVNDDIWVDRKLGSRWMFEDKIALGITINEHHEVAISAVHYSNADLADFNDGADVFGISYSYIWK